MKKKYLWPVGFAVGLFGYRVFFWGVSYDPQIFFNSAILITNALILYALSIDQDKRKKDWITFFGFIVVGVVVSYLNKSLQ